MSEIATIVFSVLNFFIIFSSPVTIFNKKISSYSGTNQFDILIVNSIFYINLLLFFSFFSLNTGYIFVIISLFAYFLFFINAKKYYLLFKKNLIIFLLFFFLLFCMFVKIAFEPILAWDGVHHWLMKAKVFYDGGYIENIKGVMMDYYPHLGTYLWGFFWKNSFLEIEYFGRFVFIFLFLISFFSCFDNFKQYSNIVKSSLIVILIYMSTDLMLLAGYQEYLLFFAFYCCSRIFVIFEKSILKKKDYLVYLVLFGFATNIFLWTKQEGFFHFIIMSIIFLMHSKIKFGQKFIFAILFATLFILFFFIKNYFFGGFHFHEDIIKQSTFENLQLSVLTEKILLITKYVLISVIKNPIWLVIVFSIFLLFKTNKDYFKKNFFVITFLFFELGFVYATFIFQSADLKWLLPLTLSRVLFPLCGFLIFTVYDCLNYFKKLNYNEQ